MTRGAGGPRAAHGTETGPQTADRQPVGKAQRPRAAPPGVKSTFCWRTSAGRQAGRIEGRVCSAGILFRGHVSPRGRIYALHVRTISHAVLHPFRGRIDRWNQDHLSKTKGITHSDMDELEAELARLRKLKAEKLTDMLKAAREEIVKLLEVISKPRTSPCIRTQYRPFPHPFRVFSVNGAVHLPTVPHSVRLSTYPALRTVPRFLATEPP